MQKQQHPVVLITGASSGIGQALAWQFARQGYGVGMLARSTDKLNKLAVEIHEAHGLPCYGAHADVRDRDQVAAAVGLLHDRLGRIDCVIANAGIGIAAPANRPHAKAMQDVYATNLFGVVHVIDAVMPYFRARNRGQIVGISSLASYISLPAIYPYCSSKAALSSYLEGLRFELAPQGIGVTTVFPGYVRTPMTQDVPDSMPFVLPVEKAAHIIYRGIVRGKNQVVFPRAYRWAIAVWRCLPMSWRVRLLSRRQQSLATITGIRDDSAVKSHASS